MARSNRIVIKRNRAICLKCSMCEEESGYRGMHCKKYYGRSLMWEDYCTWQRFNVPSSCILYTEQCVAYYNRKKHGKKNR